jgi:type VI secretion system protein ImpA
LVELDLELLLNKISPDSPCGEDLEEDSTFLKLQEEARFVEEKQMGDSIIPAEEPDWKTVRSLALELLGRTRDIQIAMHLCCALVRTDGFNGLAQGVTLLKGWLNDYWDSVHPRQDPEDDYPILRVNILSFLNDYTLMRGPISHIPLTQSALGNFSWRDIEIAEGKISPVEDEQPPEMSIIEAAFNDTDFLTLQNQAKSIQQTLEQVQGITAFVTEKVDSVNAPDLSALINLLKGIVNLVGEKVQQRQLLESEADDLETKGEPGEMPANAAVGSSATKPAGIHNRNDVVRAIDEICKYYDRYEPSSPVPFLLLRAKKLLTMNFMEIMRDMTPDAVNQAENICGIQNKD